MAPKFDIDKCVKCGVCYEICPENVIALDEEGAPYALYPYECWHCGACVMDCKVNAIHLQEPLFMRLVAKPYWHEMPEPVKKY